MGATDAGASTPATKRSCAKGLEWRKVSTAVEEISGGAVKRPSDITSIFAGTPSSTNAADFSIASRTFEPSRSMSWMNSENPSPPGCVSTTAFLPNATTASSALAGRAAEMPRMIRSCSARAPSVIDRERSATTTSRPACSALGKTGLRSAMAASAATATAALERAKRKCSRSASIARSAGIQATDLFRRASSGALAREPRLTDAHFVRSLSSASRSPAGLSFALGSISRIRLSAAVSAFWTKAGKLGERKNGSVGLEKPTWHSFDVAEKSGEVPRNATGTPGSGSDESAYGSPSRSTPSRRGSAGSVHTGPLVRAAEDSWKRTRYWRGDGVKSESVKTTSASPAET